MLKKIKDIRELPDWFSLEKYNPAKELKLKRWYEQLFTRKLCLTLGLEKAQVKRILALTRKNPILEPAKDDVLLLIQKFSAFGDHNPSAQAVHSMTLRELLMLEKNIDSEKLKYARQYINQNHLNPDAIPHQPWIDEPIIKSSQMTSESIVYATINLALPLTVLKKQSNKLLVNFKSTQDQEKRYQKPDPRNWCELCSNLVYGSKLKN